MSQLSDAISSAVEDAMADNSFDAIALAPVVWDKLDADSRKTVGISEITKLLKEGANRFAKRTLKAMASSQTEMPFGNLPGAVALDIDGRIVKAMRALHQHEFERARAIRRKQLEDDKRILDDFDAFEVAARPYWRKNPGWTVGQILSAILQKKSAAA